MNKKLLIVTALAGYLLAGATYAQERPDFTGAWTTYRGNGGAGAFSAPGGSPQYTPEAQQHIDNYRAVIEGTDYSPGNACVGSGMPASMLGSGGYPMEIIQRPEQVFVLYEAHSEIRRFYIGDEAGDPERFFRERNGYSTAKWEDDRLIVETTRLKTQVDSRYPHSEEATVREEYYIEETQEDGTRILTADLTMNDPLWLEEPFETTKRWQEMDDYHVLTYECAEPKWLDELNRLFEEHGLEMVQE